MLQAPPTDYVAEVVVDLSASEVASWNQVCRRFLWRQQEHPNGNCTLLYLSSRCVAWEVLLQHAGTGLAYSTGAAGSAVVA